jgi:hypothetical protein
MGGNAGVQGRNLNQQYGSYQLCSSLVYVRRRITDAHGHAWPMGGTAAVRHHAPPSHGTVTDWYLRSTCREPRTV